MTDNSNNRSLSRGDCEEESTIFRAIPLQACSPAPLQPLAPASLSGLKPLGRKRSPDLYTTSQAIENSRSSSLQWKLSAEEIPRVPDYPLEQTSISLGRELSLGQVTERISRFLNAQSLHCCFSNDDEHDEADDDMDEVKLSGRVDCSSQDNGLKFVVQLYRQHDDDDESYLVELQRRRGCSLDFSAVRRSLFHILKTGEVQKAAPKWSPPPFTPNKRFRVMPCTPLTRC